MRPNAYNKSNRVAWRYMCWGPGWASCSAFFIFREEFTMDLKKPLSVPEQVTRLEGHGIQINDRAAVEDVLSRINYYRFTGYALQYRKSESDSDFVDGVTFETIHNIYRFDVQLRELLRTHLETAEVYYKTKISTIFSMRKCQDPPHDQHYDENNYSHVQGFHEVISSLAREQEHFKDTLVVKHHQAKYASRMPLWVCVELLSFSNLSKLYSAMQDPEKDAIASEFGTGQKTLKNHLHCLSVLRNKCAHTARLYNTQFSPPARFPTPFLQKNPQVENDSLFAYLLVLHKRLPTQEDCDALRTGLRDLINAYGSEIRLDRMGFPENWEELLGRSRDAYKKITGTII